MSVLRGKLRWLADDQPAFYCPGCETYHAIKVGTGEGPRWTFNGNNDYPTFKPSVSVKWPDPDNPPRPMAVCHSWITDGRIQFLKDSTHKLAGKTVPLPDIPS